MSMTNRFQLCGKWGLVCLLVCRSTASADEKPAAPLSDAERAVKTVPTKIEGTYNGGKLVELRIGDRKAYLVRPTGKTDAQKRWLWEFPYWLGINDGFGNLQHRNYA